MLTFTAVSISLLYWVLKANFVVQILVHLAERHGRAAPLEHVYSFTTHVNCTRVSRDLKTLDRDLIIPGDQLLGAQGLRVNLLRGDVEVEAEEVPS